MIDETELQERAETIRKTTRRYRWRAYMSSALTDVPRDELPEVKSILQGLYFDVFEPLDIYLYLPHLWSDPGHAASMTPEEVNALDRRRIAESDFLVVCANYASFGVGQEFEIGQSLGLPILLFAHKDKTISRMLTGGAGIRIVPGDPPLCPSKGVIRYKDLDELHRQVRQRTIELVSTMKARRNQDVVLGAKLKALLQRRNWSPENLARETGFTIAFINLLLTSDSDLDGVLERSNLPAFGIKPRLGKFVNPGLWVLQELSQVLNVSLSDLVEIRMTSEDALADAARQRVAKSLRNWLVERDAAEKYPMLMGKLDTLPDAEMIAARDQDKTEQSRFFQELLDQYMRESDS